MPVPDVPPPESDEERRRRLRESLRALAVEGGDVAAQSALAAPGPEQRFDFTEEEALFGRTSDDLLGDAAARHESDVRPLASGPDELTLEPIELDRAPELADEPAPALPDDATEIDMEAEDVFGRRDDSGVSDDDLASALADRRGETPRNAAPVQPAPTAAPPQTEAPSSLMPETGASLTQPLSVDSLGSATPAIDPARARDALRAITGQEPQPYSPDRELEEAQARDRRRGAAAALLRALGAAGIGIAAAKGRPEFMPLASGLGGGLAGVVDSTRGQARDVMQQRAGEAERDQARFRREKMEQERRQAEQATRLNEARLAMEDARLGLAVTREQREALESMDMRERAQLEAQTEAQLRDPASERSRAEQTAWITALEARRTADGKPIPLTDAQRQVIQGLSAEQLSGPRSLPMQLMGITEEELRTERARILQRGQIGAARARDVRQAAQRRDESLNEQANKYGEGYEVLQRRMRAGNRLRSITERYPEGDIPGVGVSGVQGFVRAVAEAATPLTRQQIETYVTPGLTEQQRRDAVDMMSALQDFLEAHLRDESGAAIQKEEAAQRLTALGLDPSLTSADFRRGLRSAMDDVQSRMEAFAARFDPEAVQRYHGRRSGTPRGGSGGAARAGWVHDPESGEEQRVRDVEEALRRMPQLREGRAR